MRKTESGFLTICYKKLFLKEDFIVSITLKDCLSLPSLSFGKVVAGEAGLDKIVSSVSVLEFFEMCIRDRFPSPETSTFRTYKEYVPFFLKTLTPPVRVTSMPSSSW